MKKLSQITESVWTDIQKRSTGETERKEDAFNPDYVDFGENTTVYWMQDNLEIDGEGEFSFEDVKDYNNNGWRLPTLEEVLQIDWTNVRQPWYDHYTHLIFPNGIELRIKRESNNGCHMWASDYDKKFPTCAQSYGFDNMGKFNTDSFNIRWNMLRVFLVKDKKKVNESVWTDIQKRSTGEDIRKEDQLQSIDLGDHCNVYFADKDFTIGDKNEFTLDEKKSLDFPSGWRLPKISDFEDTIYQDISTYDNKPHKNIKIIDNLPEQIIIKSKKTKEDLYFDMNGEMRVIYWCDNSDDSGVEFGYCPRSTGDYVVYGGYYPNAKGRIRLVKDK